MRILFVTDFHMDAKPAGYDLHADILAAMDTIRIEAGGVDLIVLGGDIFDTPRPSPRAYQAVLDLLNDVPCPVIVLQGNHDVGALGPLGTVRAAVAQASPVFDLEQPIGWSMESKVLVVTKPQIVGFGGKQILVAPHMPQSDSAEALADAYRVAFERGLTERVAVAFCHLDIPGAKGPGGFELQAGPASIPAGVRKWTVPVLNGHIHVPQVVGCVTMPGSLVPVAFDEAGQRRLAIVEV
jgi:DNA repair exonuclease SbcCD nuclease subunit